VFHHLVPVDIVDSCCVVRSFNVVDFPQGLSHNGKNSLKIILDLNPYPGDFQNLMVSSLFEDTSLVNFLC